MTERRVLVTGGAGFIGSAVVRYLIEATEYEVLNVDKLTYAGNLESLASVSNSPRYRFAQTDICDRETLTNLFAEFQPTHVMHLAAESHVDRSIDGPAAFIETNIVVENVSLMFSRYNLVVLGMIVDTIINSDIEVVFNKILINLCI